MKTYALGFVALATLFLTGSLRAQVPQIINYQGRVAVGSVNPVNFTGTGQFKFALVDGGGHSSVQATGTATRNQITRAVDSITVTNPGSGYTSPPLVSIFGGGGSGATATATLSGGSVVSITVTNGGSNYAATPTVLIAAPTTTNYTTTYWSNDGTSAVASEPAAVVSLAVARGLYSVLLGDTTLANMTVIPASVFLNADVRLRVWFNDGANGSQLLTPDQRIAAVGYAMNAAGVNLPATTNASTGVIRQGTVPLLHTYGSHNFFAGQNAGNFTMTGGANTAIGSGAFQNNTSGELNTAVGYNALAATFGLANIAIGVNAGIGLTGGESLNIDIGNAGVAGDQNIIRIGDSHHTDTYLSGTIHIPGDIKVDGFIYNLWGGNYLSLGDGVVNGNVLWRSSDARLKQDVETIPNALDTLSRLRGVKYHWNETGQQHLTRDIEQQWRSASGTDEDNRKLWAEKRAEALATLSQPQTGFIAQELEAVFPGWVRTDEQGYKQINIEQLTGVIVQGVNELSARSNRQSATITALQKENAELKRELAVRKEADQALEARLNKLEQLIPSTPKEDIDSAAKP